MAMHRNAAPVEDSTPNKTQRCAQKESQDRKSNLMKGTQISYPLAGQGRRPCNHGPEKTRLKSN